jgi:hypothetical protein
MFGLRQAAHEKHYNGERARSDDRRGLVHLTYPEPELVHQRVAVDLIHERFEDAADLVCQDRVASVVICRK